jgi:hypothetical protein
MGAKCEPAFPGTARSRELGSTADYLYILLGESRLSAKNAAGPALARIAMANGDADGFTRGLGLELTTAARGCAFHGMRAGIDACHRPSKTGARK